MSAHSNRNLQTEYNAYFESCLALALAEHRDLFPTVDLISKHIIEIITSRKKEILMTLNNKTRFETVLRNLYNKDFGALANKKETPEAMLNDIQTMLMDKSASLVNVMAIHYIFGSHLLRFLEKENYAAIKPHFEIVQSLVNVTKKHVERKPEENVASTCQLGIVRLPFFCEKMNSVLHATHVKQYICEHKTSLERFEIEYTAAIFREFIRHHLPLAAGLSTHTLELLMAVKLYEMKTLKPFTQAEWQEYSLAYFVYLTLAGYHTFHEVMLVTATYLNVSYQLDSYLSHFPPHLKQHPFIKAFAKKFPLQLKVK